MCVLHLTGPLVSIFASKRTKMLIIARLGVDLGLTDFPLGPLDLCLWQRLSRL